MKERIATEGISLVVLLLAATAHGRVAARLAPIAKYGAAVNVKDTADGAKDISSRTESVVQDWSLVCEQLCRAGLGGPSCGPPCDQITDSSKHHRTEAAHYLLGDRREDICSFLCGHGLGELSCECKLRSKLPDALDRDTVCSTFCQAANLTISGCTPCKHGDSTTKAPIRTTAMPPTTRLTTTTGIHHGIISVPELSLTIGDADENGSASTTPNWNEYCLSLCKIGEGGSLCNCDLPPFF